MEIYENNWGFEQIYSFKTLILLWKNYGTMEKTMVLWTKLWYYTENYGTLIYYGKLWYYGKNYDTMDKTMVLTVNVLYLARMIFGGISILGYLAWIWIGVSF